MLANHEGTHRGTNRSNNRKYVQEVYQRSLRGAQSPRLGSLSWSYDSGFTAMSFRSYQRLASILSVFCLIGQGPETSRFWIWFWP